MSMDSLSKSAISSQERREIRMVCRSLRQMSVMEYETSVDGSTVHYLCRDCGHHGQVQPGSRKEIKAAIRQQHGGTKPSRLSPRGSKEKRVARFQRDFGGEAYVRWIKSLPCDACGAPPLSQCSHIHTRNGGGVTTPRWRCIVPHCWTCHRKFEAGPEAFAREYGDQDQRAEHYAATWDEHGGAISGQD